MSTFGEDLIQSLNEALAHAKGELCPTRVAKATDHALTSGGKTQVTDTITISVDPDLAEAYRAASNQERRKLDFLLNLRLRDATRTGESLHDVMAEITANARARGLTPEILEELLRD